MTEVTAADTLSLYDRIELVDAVRIETHWLSTFAQHAEMLVLLPIEAVPGLADLLPADDLCADQFGKKCLALGRPGMQTTGNYFPQREYRLTDVIRWTKALRDRQRQKDALQAKGLLERKVKELERKLA